jgi:hypothetical protein
MEIAKLVTVGGMHMYNPFGHKTEVVYIPKAQRRGNLQTLLNWININEWPWLRAKGRRRTQKYKRLMRAVENVANGRVNRHKVDCLVPNSGNVPARESNKDK